MHKEIWAIGDIQGCSESLRALLARPELTENPKAKFWFAGDLVNRGPGSLETLRIIMSMGKRARCVLGNHDLHCLAVYAGIRQAHKTDTLMDIINAPDVEDIIDWLRDQPLAYYAHDHLMVHAGVMSKWSLEKALALSAEVQEKLRSKDWKSHLANMYGNEPTQWRNSLEGEKRLRVIVNGFTRMRMCTYKGELCLAYKGTPQHQEDFLPWFEVPTRKTRNVTIVFGHWSALGLLNRPHLIGLDTGCVWGGKLSAMRLGDRKLVQVDRVEPMPERS